MKKISKITKILALVMIGAIVGFPIKVFFAHAEDNSPSFQEIENKDSSEQENNNDQENGVENEDGQSNEEHDVFSLILTDQGKSEAVKVSEVDQKTLQTYADVVSALKMYEDAVLKISANAGVSTNDTSLTTGEKTLLDSLLNKHHNQFDRFNNRITEVKTQLKQLEDLLSPLGTQPISSMYGIKGLLVSELNNFKDIINGISEFDGLNSQILQEETN